MAVEPPAEPVVLALVVIVVVVREVVVVVVLVVEVLTLLRLPALVAVQSRLLANLVRTARTNCSRLDPVVVPSRRMLIEVLSAPM